MVTIGATFVYVMYNMGYHRQHRKGEQQGEK